MRKEYEAPKAEKVEFDYKEIVVASVCESGIGDFYKKEEMTGTECREEYTGSGQVWHTPKAN